MSSRSTTPSISVVIPTLNCESTLEECLSSLDLQSYPGGRIETIVVDGGSRDRTRAVAENHGCRILDNPLVNHPRGRPIGFRAAKGDLVLCLDSDNVLDTDKWLHEMVLPFADPDIVATEPCFYTARRHDNALTKYVALIGGDDPLAVYAGFYDRFSTLTMHWTGCKVIEEDRGEFIKVRFPDRLHPPPIGANGFMIRRDVLNKVQFDPFLHVEVFKSIISRPESAIAKVKVGVIHLHSADTREFMRKKLRRLRRRRSNHDKVVGQLPPWSVLVLGYSLLLGRPFLDTLRGLILRPSAAWLYHPLLTYGTAFSYFAALLPIRTPSDFERAGH